MSNKGNYVKKSTIGIAAVVLAFSAVISGSAPAFAATASYGAISCGAGWGGTQVTGYGTLNASSQYGIKSYGKQWVVAWPWFESHRYAPAHVLTGTTAYASGGFFSGTGNGKGCWSTFGS